MKPHMKSDDGDKAVESKLMGAESTQIAAGQLKALVERIERLPEQHRANDADPVYDHRFEGCLSV